MQIEQKTNCPLDGFNPCRKLDCAWFMKVVGKNPNTGKDIEEWGCAMTWMPILTIENSQQQRQTGAAVESFRNEMVKANEVSQRVLLAAAKVTSNAENYSDDRMKTNLGNIPDALSRRVKG